MGLKPEAGLPANRGLSFLTVAASGMEDYLPAPGQKQVNSRLVSMAGWVGGPRKQPPLALPETDRDLSLKHNKEVRLIATDELKTGDWLV